MPNPNPRKRYHLHILCLEKNISLADLTAKALDSKGA